MYSRFPLFRLPSKAIINVLQSVDFLEKIAFSLISKSTKSYILKTRLRASFVLNIRETVELEVSSQRTKLIFSLTPPRPYFWADGPMRVVMAKEVTILKPDATTHVFKNKKGFKVRDWIWHIQDITRQKSFDIIVYFDGWRMMVHEIAKMIAGFNVNTLNTRDHFTFGRRHFHRAILEKIHTKSLAISRNPFRQNPEEIHKIFCQNFVQLNVGNMAITLNDILVMNSPVILITVDTMKTINRFIKLWQAGASGNLRYIRIFVGHGWIADEDVILEGVKHSMADPEVWRPFVDLANGELRMMNGGYDLLRKDRTTKATIFIDHITRNFEMFVED